MTKTNRLLMIYLMFVLTFTLPISTGVQAETFNNEKQNIAVQDEIDQIEELINEPESDDFAGYTVKIENGISDTMSDVIDNSNNAEQLTDKFVQVDNAQDVLEFAEPEEVGYIEPNYYVYPDEYMGLEEDIITGHPNDPNYGESYIDESTSSEAFKVNQWSLEMVNARAAWEKGLRGRGVKVGFIDTGFNNSYNDLYSGRVLTGKNFTGVNISNNVNDTSLHGTRVASIVYASINNGIDMAGIADLISVVPLKVGNGTTLSTGADVVKAIEYARKNGIQVINMSMGMNQPYQPMDEQINYFSLEGGIFVTSGGNQARTEPRYPAGCYNSVAVGGVTKTGEVWENSNHNSSIDVTAPAKSVLHILGVNGTGTSYSAPHVTALAAIAKQYSKGKINITEFKKLLETSSTDAGEPGRDDYYGNGIVNYEEFLNQINEENSNGTADVIPYPVYYKLNGGIISSSYENFYDGKTNFKLPKIKRTGYTFLGWYSTSGFDGEPQTHIPSGSTGKKTFYAKWQAKSYTIKFNVNKGKKINTKSKIATYNSAVGKMPIPKRTGYKFAGWFTKKTGGTQYSRYKTYKITKSITLYAHWTKDNIFTFYPNGGKVNISKKIVKKGKKIGTLPKATKKGYNFLGWFTKKKGGKQYTSTMTYDKKKNIKVYARWTKKKIVQFNANGGKVTKYAKAVVQSNQLGTLPVPKRTKYKFTGWYTKKKGGTIRTKISIVKTSENFILYAHWTKKKK